MDPACLVKRQIPRRLCILGNICIFHENKGLQIGKTCYTLAQPDGIDLLTATHYNNLKLKHFASSLHCISKTCCPEELHSLLVSRH